jgi:hypothetical protein
MKTVAPSFFQTILDFFFKNETPEAIKNRSIRTIAKQIKSNRNSIFYLPGTKEFTPGCEKFFYDIYKTLCIAQEYIPVLLESGNVQYLVIEQFIDQEILEGFDNLSPERIMERAGGVNPGDLPEKLRGEAETLIRAMDTTIGGQIDSCYNQILALGQLVSFDFETLLTFCFTDRGFNFRGDQGSDPFRTKRIIGLLQDFVEYCAAVDSFQDWDHVFAILKTFRNGKDMISRKRWGILRYNIRGILRSEILVLIIRHITGDPLWSIQSQIPRERIFSNWLADKRQTMEDAISLRVTSHRVDRIAELKQLVFGNIVVEPLEHYNEESSTLFTAKGFEGFIHTASLTYLLAFQREVFEKEIQQFCDLLTIHARWTPPSLSLPFRQACQALESLMKQLDDFDESLGNGIINSSSLVTALTRFERDRSYGLVIDELLEKVNAEALGILEQTPEILVNLANQVESVYNDHARTPHTLIANWRELKPDPGQNMAPLLQSIAEKLSGFTELARLLIGD